MSKVLSSINIASQYLQSTGAELHLAVDHLSSTQQRLSIYREKFDEVKAEAAAISAKWGLSATFEQKRISKAKRHFDELSEDCRLTDPEDAFRINVFNVTIDTVTSQLHHRFCAMKQVTELFSILNPTTLAEIDSQLLFEKAKILQTEYHSDLSTAFPLQIVCFRDSMQGEIAKLNSVRQLARMLIVENSSVSSGFTEVVTALLLFLTLPVTVATAERSFSKLKLIKNYLRNSMGQTRLCGLSLLAIEANHAKSMDMNELINQFADMKTRRIRLT